MESNVAAFLSLVFIFIHFFTERLHWHSLSCPYKHHSAIAAKPQPYEPNDSIRELMMSPMLRRLTNESHPMQAFKVIISWDKFVAHSKFQSPAVHCQVVYVMTTQSKPASSALGRLFINHSAGPALDLRISTRCGATFEFWRP